MPIERDLSNFEFDSGMPYHNELLAQNGITIKHRDFRLIAAFAPAEHRAYRPEIYLSLVRAAIAEDSTLSGQVEPKLEELNMAIQTLQRHPLEVAVIAALQSSMQLDQAPDEQALDEMIVSAEHSVARLLSAPQISEFWHQAAILRRKGQDDMVARVCDTFILNASGIAAAARTSVAFDDGEATYGLTPLTDLPKETSEPIAEEIFRQWRALLSAGLECGVPLSKTKRRPLLFFDIADLHKRMARGRVPPDQVFRSFYALGRDFLEVNRKREVHTGHNRRLARWEVEIEQIAVRALSDPQIAAFLTNREPEAILPLESEDDASAIIWGQVGQLESEMREEYGPPDHHVWPKFRKDYHALLRPKNFHGKLQNFRAISLEVTQEFVDAHFKAEAAKYDIQPEDVARLMICADMRSTGIGVVGQSILDVVISRRFARDPSKRKMRIDALPREGQKAADALMRAVRFSSYAAVISALDMTMPAGNPGSGKKR